jgi:hypothetical protein
VIRIRYVIVPKTGTVTLSEGGLGATNGVAVCRWNPRPTPHRPVGRCLPARLAARTPLSLAATAVEQPLREDRRNPHQG